MPRARILIVEDESVSALFMRLMLEKEGHQVSDCVRSGEEAILKADELKPDLMLMDIKLDGEIDGVEAADTILGRHGIPSIFMTAYTQDEFTREYRLAPDVEPLQKPVQIGDLLQQIDRLLAAKGAG